jgi:methionyl-tRNA synthetase
MAYYVTTPIYYVNAQPHLGHAYTTIAADILARHMRQRGEDVFFLTGTDEHGEPVAQVAEREGIDPRELADRNSERFLDMAKRVNASNDFFIRTSDPRHVEAVQQVLQQVYDNGYVYKGLYEGWYCPRCADFKTEQEIVDGNRCPIHGIELTWEEEENYFFKLSAFQEPLERLYADRQDWIRPQNRYNEAISFIRQGLNDVSLTRGKLTWGVPVPWDPGHVFYVWFDALLNYYTALRFARPGEDLTARFWPADVHLIGKDILKFHAVFWPALLMAADIEVPRSEFVHGYLLMNDQKMSKSLGNVIDPFEVIDKFGADPLRFYLFREVSFGQDGSVSTEGFEQRYNSELANELGNLVNRAHSMIGKFRDGTIPVGDPPPELVEEFDGLVDDVRSAMDRSEISAALDTIWKRVRGLNRFVQDQAPWKLAKDESAAAQLDSVLYGLAEGLRVVGVLLLAFIPDKADELLSALGVDERSIDHARFGAVGGGAPLGPLEALFPRIEREPA